MAKKNLSTRQKNILQYIVDYIQKMARPPTIREIGKSVEISSTSVVNYNLARLQEHGLLTRSADVARGIQPTERAYQLFGIIASGNSYHVPLIGNIAAGLPIDLPESNFAVYDHHLDISASLIKGSMQNLFALRVTGDSMIDAMVNDGDIVVLRTQVEARNGDMVAALVKRDTTTLKYYFNEGEQIRLQPANRTMEPIYAAAEDVQLFGKVELVIRYP